jgi:hypothetical protein
MTPGELVRVAGLAEGCAVAAGAVDHSRPGALAGLTAEIEALDVALRQVVAGVPSLPDLRDAVGDHLVALSAAGMPTVERQAVATSLAAVLAEAADLLRARAAAEFGQPASRGAPAL